MRREGIGEQVGSAWYGGTLIVIALARARRKKTKSRYLVAALISSPIEIVMSYTGDEVAV